MGYNKLPQIDNEIFSALRCYACDELLTEQEEFLLDELDGLCQTCFDEAMDALNDFDEENDKSF